MCLLSGKTGKVVLLIFIFATDSGKSGSPRFFLVCLAFLDFVCFLKSKHQKKRFSFACLIVCLVAMPSAMMLILVQAIGVRQYASF